MLFCFCFCPVALPHGAVVGLQCVIVVFHDHTLILFEGSTLFTQSVKGIQFLFEYKVCDTSIYTMVHPKNILSARMKNTLVHRKG